MNELKLIELLMTSPVIYIGFAILVWLLTYLVKKPIKRLTNQIRDEKKRKLYNKWILLIPFILSVIVLMIYYGIVDAWFVNFERILSDAFSVAVLAIVIYNIFSDIVGKKSEYELTEDGRNVFNLLLVYAKDKNKVKMMLDQAKENYDKGKFTITETVKAWLPENVDQDSVNTVVKIIKNYFDEKKRKSDLIDE